MECKPVTIADIFFALAQHNRLKILEILKDGEKCSCDIWRQVGEQSNVSRHISVLKKAGLLVMRKDGVRSYYSIKNTKIFDLIKLASEILKENDEL